jgi:drug/metabolite transporter (DMT)-like permease
MFIGEMGCWLVVAGFSIYRRYFPKDAPLFRGGYEHLHDEEDDAGMEGESRELRRSSSTGGGSTSANPVVAALLPNDDSRSPLVGARVFLLALPACCDITGTTLMNVGLLFVAASIYQMTRGALVLFVGLFSVVFLRRKLYLYQWSALFIVVLGVGIVGLAGALSPKEATIKPDSQPQQPTILIIRAAFDQIRATSKTPAALQTIIGVLMIAAAQIFTATQFVLEEWILEHYALEPLKVVGWEGIFGFFVTLTGMIILHLSIGRTERGRYGYFDAKEGWRELVEYRAIAISSILIMISIGGFNFFGLSVTRSVSATARSTIDTSRTLFIWIVSLALGWETFKWLQIVGFALLVYGTFLFNDIVQPPLKACLRDGYHTKKHEPLLPEEPIEHS